MHMTKLTYVTLDNHVQHLRQTDVDAFATSISGGVLRAADNAYEDARKVWNGMTDRRPGFIARCLTDADVQSPVRFAATHCTLVSVRGGGHHIAGHADADQDRKSTRLNSSHTV